MAATIGSLNVNATLKTAAFMTGARQVERRMQRLQGNLRTIGTRMSSIGSSMSLAITAPLTAFMARAIPAAAESRQALAQVESALASTGAAAGRSSAQLQEAAGHLQSISTFDDDDILRQGTANLLRFGNIAGDVFDRAQLAAVNYAARTGQSLSNAFALIGRALNDPIRGMTVLRRSGVMLDEEQQRQIRTFVASGRMAQAQGVILDALSVKFDGAAQALRNSTPGADVAEQWRTFQEVVGELALKVLPPLTDALTGILRAFNELSPSTQRMIVVAGGLAAALGPVLMVLGPIVSGMGRLVPFIASLGGASVVTAGAMGTLAAAIPPIAIAATAVYVAFQNWDKITGFVDRLKARLDETVPAAQAAERELAAIRNAQWDWSSQESFFQAAGQAMENFVVDFSRGLRDLDRDLNAANDWIDRFDARMIEMARNGWRAFEEWHAGMQRWADGVKASITSTVTHIAHWMGGQLDGIWNRVKAGVDRVKGFFHGLWDAVVGHSYIPDMVDGIAAHMRRLDEVMVAQARRATTSTADAFRDLQQEVAGILARLFPEQARENQYRRELERIEAYARRVKWSAEETAEAIRRLRAEYLNDAVGPQAGISANVRQAEPDLPRRRADDLGAHGEVPDWMSRQLQPAASWAEILSNAMRNLGAIGNRSISDIARSVESGLTPSLRGATGAASQLQGAFQQIGQLLGQGIGSVLDVFLPKRIAHGVGSVLGQIGASVVQSKFGGFRAAGGPVLPNHAYIVGERGPELFTPGRSGSIIPNMRLDGGGERAPVRVEVVPSPYFDVVVDQRAAAVAAPMAAQAAQHGAGMALGRINRSMRMRLP